MRHYKYLLLLVLATMAMGAEFPIIKIGLDTVPPMYFIALRFVFAFLALLMINMKTIRNGIKSMKLLPSAVLSLFLFMGFVTANFGIKNTTATNSGFYISLVVLFAPILECLIFRKPLTRKILVCVLISLIGIFLISTDAGTLDFNRGDLLCIASALFYSLHIVFTGIYVKKHDPLLLSAVQIGFVSIWGFFAGVLFEPMPGFIAIGFSGWMALLFTGIVATSFVYTVQSYAQTEISSSNIGIIYSLEPVFAALLSAVMLGERIGIKGIVGGGFIVLSALICNFSMFRTEQRFGDNGDMEFRI